MQFQVLGSSSSGNVAIVTTPETTVLIDAGLSGLKIRRLLGEVGRSIDEVDAVFLTHEHTDHTAGVLGLSKYPHLQFFANRDTADAVKRRLKRTINWQIFETGDHFLFKDVDIRTFSIPHDAYDPVGYIFETQSREANPRRLAWVTDLGHIPPAVKHMVKDVDLLVLESNYDEELLEKDTRRPWAIKQRIRGRHGHLSNTDAYTFLATQEKAQWQHVHLVHLSRDCNCPNLLQGLFAPLSQELKRFEISVFDPHGGPGRLFDLATFGNN